MAQNCGICNSGKLTEVLEKAGKDGEIYTLFSCEVCKIVQVHPIPSQEKLDTYYSGDYFLKRSDRGYDNYYSPEMKKELSRVWTMNLNDLNVQLNQSNNDTNLRSLDIGCAAGFFVDYMRNLGWDAYGIEIAPDPIRYGREVLGLTIHRSDFMDWDRNGDEKFDLITLWASIEHMRDPISILKKIRKHLTPNGYLVLSTCRWGIQAKWRKEKWRFLNVPEHLFYFGWDSFLNIMKAQGYKCTGSISYGSGMTQKKNAGIFYRITKKIADPLVKWLNQGDMMAFSFKREDIS